MLTGILLIFIAVPLIELWVLLQIGEILGVFYTLGVVILTAVIGVQLLRYQGVRVLWKAGHTLKGGVLPTTELAEGFLLALAGALLLTPGFLTDGMGFLLMITPVRYYVIDKLGRHWMSSWAEVNQRKQDTSFKKGETIEGQYQERN
jgi:UPF0716 protein FxsA